jgi:hypothetical protein
MTSSRKISELPAGQALTGAEIVPVVQSGETRQVPARILGARHTFDVQRYGAAYNGTTNDADAIEAAIAAAVAARGTNTVPIVYFPPGQCRSDSPTVIPHGISIVMDGELHYGGPNDAVALTVGSEDARSQRLRIEVQVRGLAGRQVDVPGQVGVRLNNLYFSDIRIRDVWGFHVGVQCWTGNGHGWVYNEVSLGRIHLCYVYLDLVAVTGGWIKETNWYGGNFSGAPKTWRGEPHLIGVRMHSGPGTVSEHVFHGPSFELGQISSTMHNVEPDSHPPLVVHATNASKNEWRNIRVESMGRAGEPVAVFHGTADNRTFQNVITWNYGEAQRPVLESGPQRSTASVSITNEHLSTALWESPALHRVWCYADGETEVNIPGVVLRHHGNDLAWTGGLTPHDRYMDIANRHVGVYVDTVGAKKFWAYVDCEPGFEPRLMVTAYAEDGTVLHDDALAESYVTGHPGDGMSVTGSSRQWYSAVPGRFFAVRPEVASIWVSVFTTTASTARVRSFGLRVMHDGRRTMPTVHLGGLERGPAGNRGIAAPTAGTWPHGMTVWNAQPTVGGPAGWMCVSAGTPGTWEPFGTVGS